MGGSMHMSGPMWMPMLPPTWARIFAFHPQPVIVIPLISLLGLLAYWAAVIRLARRGVRWPWSRTLMWTLGIVVIEMSTTTGVEGYGMAMFSVHMAQHMALGMVAPILLVAAAPMTLALRTLPTRGTGSGARRFLVAMLAHPVFKALCFPLVRWFMFLFSLYGIYFTGVFDWLMSNVWGHNLMLVHFILTGMFFFGPLVHADPWPGTKVPIYRLLETFLSTPFHVFFGITLMEMSIPVVRFFTTPPPAWHLDVMNDQNLGGAIAWVTAEIPTVMLMLLILREWRRTDAREAARADRRAERTGDAELVAYNAMLADLARLDGEAVPSTSGRPDLSRAAERDE